ncbi:MAG: HAMP domain-containing protein, partial [Sedimentibacter sp.]
MKNIIIVRITILMTIAILISSILVASIGLFLVENIKTENRGKEFVPTLSALTELTVQYEDGNINKETYENILKNSTKEYLREYIVLNADGTVVFPQEDKIDSSVKKQATESLKEVLQGKATFRKTYNSSNESFDLIGVPIINNNENTGAVFALLDRVDFLPERDNFFQTLLISMLIVIAFVIMLSYLVLKRIIKPIKNAVTAGISMSQGDFSIRADETLQGEIGLLGKTLNKLSVDLYKNVSQLFIEKNRLNQVLNSLDEGMIAVDENKKITHYNKVFLEMFELTDEIKG